MIFFRCCIWTSHWGNHGIAFSQWHPLWWHSLSNLTWRVCCHWWASMSSFFLTCSHCCNFPGWPDILFLYDSLLLSLLLSYLGKVQQLWQEQWVTLSPPPSSASSWRARSLTSCPWWWLSFLPTWWPRVCSPASTTASSKWRSCPTCQTWAGIT